MTDKQIPAFPVGLEAFGEDKTGMTLRDYFAAKAMQTILKDQYEDGLYVGDGIENTDLYAELCAVSSYIMADAMIKARNVKT
jgi:hypothetical protein